MGQEQRISETCPAVVDATSTAPASPSSPDVHAAGERAQGGAPNDNENALKSGVSAWLKSCRIPSAYRSLRRRIKELGQHLAGDVAALKGRPPNECETIAIERFIRAAGAMALMERWLDQERNDLGISDRLALLKQIDAAGERMAKMLKELGFDEEAALDPRTASLMRLERAKEQWLAQTRQDTADAPDATTDTQEGHHA